MKMNKFLDTCLIISYASEGIELPGKYENFVKNKNSMFYVCYFVLEKDIPSLIQRYSEIFKELKKQNPDFTKLINEKRIFKKDFNFAYKLLLFKEAIIKKGIDFAEFISAIEEIFLVRIDFFIANKIDKKVIPVDKIDNELRSSLFTWTQNNSDSNTLASGIQFHNNEEEIILVTGDKTDWTKENLEKSVCLHPSLRLKYKKMPEICYV